VRSVCAHDHVPDAVVRIPARSRQRLESIFIEKVPSALRTYSRSCARSELSPFWTAPSSCWAEAKSATWAG
jgi:hypothetical protein